MNKEKRQMYRIKYPVKRDGLPQRWITIGIATQRDKDIACTIESVPLNWNGAFYLMPIDDKEDDA